MEQRKLIGSKPTLRTKDIWSIRTKLQMEKRQFGHMFHLAIDSKAMPGSTIARPLLLDPKSDSPTRHSVVDSACRTNCRARTMNPPLARLGRERHLQRARRSMGKMEGDEPT